MGFSIRGIQEAERANLRHIRDLRLGKSVNQAVKWGAAATQRAAVPLTPWDTSALRNSHRITMKPSQHRAFIHIDQSAVNPRGQRPAEYGPHLHRQGLRPGLKGGVRAFYLATVQRYGQRIAQGMARFFIRRFR